MENQIICKSCGGNKWKLVVAEHSHSVIMICDAIGTQCEFGHIQSEEPQSLKVRLSYYEDRNLESTLSRVINA